MILIAKLINKGQNIVNNSIITSLNDSLLKTSLKKIIKISKFVKDKNMSAKIIVDTLDNM